jgi:hypothetical protein
MKKILRGSWWKVAAAVSTVGAILVAGGAGTLWG